MALGHDRRLFLLPLEAAGQDVAGRAEGPGTPGGDLAVVAPMVLDALAEASADLAVPPGEVGVLLDVPEPADLVRRARTRGLAVVVPADDRTAERFALAHGEDFGRHIDQLAPDLTSVRVRWHPDDDPAVKKQQALGLTKLTAWLHETERSLLVELLAAAPGSAAADDDPARTAEAVREIRGLGIEPDVWSFAPRFDRAAAEDLADLVRDEGRDGVGALVRLAGADDLAAAPATWRGLAAYRGVVLAPSAWSDELRSSGGPERSREEVGRAIRDRLVAILERVTASPDAP